MKKSNKFVGRCRGEEAEEMESSAGGLRPPWEATVCTIVAADTVDFCYRACAVCDRPLPADSRCPLCAPRSTPNPPPPSTLLYRLLVL